MTLFGFTIWKLLIAWAAIAVFVSPLIGFYIEKARGSDDQET